MAEEGRSPSPSSPQSQSLSPPRRLSRSSSPPRGRLALSSSPPSRARSRSWSPPSPPPPSPPQAKAEKRSFYLFFDHSPAEGTGLSLCTVEVEIPSVYSRTCPAPPSPITIVPTLLFSTTDFPTPMRCVHLGSKFYFLGGEISLEDDEEVESFTRDQLYPPDVYIFDPTTPKAKANANSKDAKDFVTPGPPMNTGKPSQVFLFVAYGKIYALSPPMLRMLFDNYPLEYFEVFDPKTNKWACLPPPPLKNFNLQSHLIVKSKVYITAWQYFNPECKLCCFDLDKKEWEPSVPLLSSQLICRGLHVSDLMDDIVENSLYWFGFLHDSIVASGPVEATEVADGECFKNLICMSPVDTLPARSCLGRFFHLGNRRICYVEGYHDPIVPPIPDYDEAIYDEKTLYIGLTIFETLSHTFADRDGRNYSKAKLLLHAIFVTEIPVDGNEARLCNCSLIPIAANDAGFNGEAEL